MTGLEGEGKICDFVKGHSVKSSNGAMLEAAEYSFYKKNCLSWLEWKSTKSSFIMKKMYISRKKIAFKKKDSLFK